MRKTFGVVVVGVEHLKGIIWVGSGESWTFVGLLEWDVVRTFAFPTVEVCSCGGGQGEGRLGLEVSKAEQSVC